MPAQRRYAQDTQVEAGRSLEEIRRLVKAAGATNWQHGEDEAAGLSWVQFRLSGFLVRFTVKLATARDDAVQYTPAGRIRLRDAIPGAIEQETKRRWRELALLVKAKLIAAQSGIVSIQEELLPYIVLDNDETVGSYIVPRLAALQAAARGDRDLPLLPPARVTEE